MSGARRFGTAPAIVGLALAASLALTGCSGGFFGNGASGGSGGTSGEGQSGTSGDDPIVEPDEPTAEEPTVPEIDPESIPADFPSDIPLIDGDVTFGLSMGSGWTIVFSVADAEAAFTQASSKLQAAGFTSQGEARSPDGSAGAYDSPKYVVQMTSSTSDDAGPTVVYVVTTKS